MQAITIGKLLRRRLRNRKGFSLIETSVLVSAAAAAAVGFLSWTQPAAITNSANAVETRVKIDAIAKALENFRVEKGRLPCPADPYMRVDNTRSSAGGTDHYPNDFGQEDLDTIDTIVNSVTNYGVDCPVSTGAIPVYAIGLGQEYMNDAWGRRFTYQISKTVCAADAGTEGGVSIANSRLFGCTKNDYNKGNGDIIIKDTAAVTKADKAVAVIVSHGPNGKGAFMPSGIKLTNDGSANEIENGNSDNTGSATDKTFIMGTASATFDDIVYFKTKVQMERLTDRANTKQISVADCQTNSEAIRAITATESTVMATQVTGFERGSNNTGEQVALSLLKTIQSMCVTYYGATTGITTGWSGAQCPGTANINVITNSTYYAPTDTCTCLGGLWDGNCAPDFNIIAAAVLPTTGRALWLDANDPATLFTDTGCTVAAVATNSLACWKDKSGNSGRNATQSGNKPTYQTGATAGTGSGRPAIRFTAASAQYLDTAAFDMGQNTTFCTVFKSLTTANMHLFDIATVSLPEFYMSTNGGLAYNSIWNGSGDTGQIATTASAGTFRTLCYTFNNSANTAQTSLNGTLGTATTATSSNAGSIGRRVGGHPNTAIWYDGYMAEIIAYNRALTDVERKGIEKYLGAKWGITIAP